MGFDSLEWLLKRLSALAELTHKLAKKPWALCARPRRSAGHSGQAQAALLLSPQSNSLHGLSKFSAFASLRKNFLRVAIAMQEAWGIASPIPSQSCVIIGTQIDEPESGIGSGEN